MPTEGFEKGKIYFKSQEDEEYKELGVGTIEFNAEEAEENEHFKEMEDLYNETGFTVELEIKLKKYSKKRFKKLLMSYGIQRDDAEIFATIAEDKKSYLTRNDFGLIIAKGIATAWKYGNSKRKKVKNNGKLV